MANTRLYPPIINGTLPAFTGTTIVVPFALNRAVSQNDIGGFLIKLKTVQGEVLLANNLDMSSSQDLNNALIYMKANFDLPNEVQNRIQVGQYLKLQMAFRDKMGVVGYFSTVGIIKYTAEPEVYIENALDTSNEEIPVFKQFYTGVYRQNDDINEKVYQYKFELYDNKQILVHSSGWLLHNSELDAANSNIINQLKESIDTYQYNIQLEPYKKYYIRYGVKTINGLERFSRKYAVEEIEGSKPNMKADLIAESNFEDGFVALHLEPHEDSMIVTRGTYLLLRNDLTEGEGYNWQTLKYLTFSPSVILSNWKFNDFTVEQGRKYQYALQQYNDNGIFSSRLTSNTVEVDFEDMFLYDGNRQLKLRFDPKVTSFKINRLETKTDTIGSKYPYFYRNGHVEYREFPIAAKLSYLADDNQFFMTYKELHLEDPKSFYRFTTPNNKDIAQYRQPTTSKVGYNFFAEREFKMTALEWLTNGEPKLFKSPGEGNYIVRLMNVSLTPDDKTQRLIHSFTSTAYEIAEVTYEHLLSFGFIDNTVPDNTYITYKTDSLLNSDGTFKTAGSYVAVSPTEEKSEDVTYYRKNGNNYVPVPFDELNPSTTYYIWEYSDVKINSNPIQGYFAIKDLLPGDLSNDTGGEMGEYLIAKQIVDGVEETQKIVIGPNGALQIRVDDDTILPDMYIPAGKEYLGSITYQYKATIVSAFNLINNITILNQISTFTTLEDSVDIITNFVSNIKKETLNFINLHFYPKQQLEIYSVNYSGNNYMYYLDKDFTKQIFYFDKTKVYFVHNYFMDNESRPVHLNDFYAIGDGSNRLNRVESVNDTFSVNGSEFKQAAHIKFPSGEYSSIIIGNGVVVDAVYQTKIIKYSIEDEDSELLAAAATYGENSGEYLDLLTQKIKELEDQMEADA